MGFRFRKEMKHLALRPSSASPSSVTPEIRAGSERPDSGPHSDPGQRRPAEPFLGSSPSEGLGHGAVFRALVVKSGRSVAGSIEGVMPVARSKPVRAWHREIPVRARVLPPVRGALRWYHCCLLGISFKFKRCLNMMQMLCYRAFRIRFDCLPSWPP